MTQCIVELLKIFEALEELLFSLQCLSLFDWGLFPMMKYIIPKQNHYWKQESPIKSHKFLSLAVTWAGVSGSCICSVVWSREVLPHPGLERTKQPTGDFQTMSACSPGQILLVSLGRMTQVYSAIVHGIQTFPCLYLSLCLSTPLLLPQFEAVELPWILILILKVGFLMFFFWDHFWSVLGMIDWCLVWWK